MMCNRVNNKNCPNTRIDRCMKNICGFIDKHTPFRVLACCCGHKKYPMSIIIQLRGFDTKIELFSNKIIRRKRNFYRRDKQGYYYIPEVNGEQWKQ